MIYSLAFPVSLRESLEPLRAAQAATHMQRETLPSGLAFSVSRRFALVVYELLMQASRMNFAIQDLDIALLTPA